MANVCGAVGFGQVRLVVALGCALGLAGCGGSMSSAPSTTTPAAVTVTVTGGNSVRLGGSQQMTATVGNSSNTAVTWQVNGVTGGAAATGMISTTGLYTPPTVIPNPSTVTIAAVSQASPAVSGSLAEAVLNPVPVVSSAVATQTAVGTGFALDVKGAGFVAGSTLQVNGATVAATLVSTTELKASITVASGTASVPVVVTNPDPGGSGTTGAVVAVEVVSIAGANQVRLGGTQQFTASVSGVSGATVTWQVNGVTGGAAGTGTISTTGLYTPPAAIPTPNAVTITAVNGAAAGSSATVSAAVVNPLPVVTSALATQTATGSAYSLDVLGTGFVSGSAILVNGSAVATTFLSATELKAAITVTAGIATVPVAVTNPDPGGSGSTVAQAQVQTVAVGLASAARLLDQATFGPTLNDIQHVQSIGVNAYLTEQFATSTTLLADIPAAPTVICTATSLTPCEQSEWWQTVITGKDQLRQRVAFALSEMMVISTNSVNANAVIPYHNILANDAFANFYTLMKDVTLSTGMGAYLNMLNSYKPGNGQIANENYSRELMQLFTIGLNELNQDGTLQLDSSGNPIPTYTEAQVQAFARAYTGWTYASATGGAPTKFPNGTANYDAPMAAVESAHDTTAKTLLGGTVLPAGGSSAQDLTGALTNIFNNPNVGPFVCKQLIQHLVSSNPTPAYVSRISAVFANNGAGVRGDMQAVVKAILTDTEARAGDADNNAEGGHLREGILYVANVVRGLGYTNTSTVGDWSSLGNYSAPLGERPYAAGSVFNFFPPDYVLPDTTVLAPEFGQENTATGILRLTLADNMVYNRLSNFTVDLSKTSALGMTASTTASGAANLVDSLGIIFMHGQMPSNMRTTIINEITPFTDPSQRVRVAAYLILTSSQYKIIH